jgi:hypothetical protein
VSAAAVVVVLGVLTGAADCLDALGDSPTCQANCAVEVECGFRTEAACEAASCNPVTGAVLNGSLDACLGAASDCLEAAACPCDGGCAKIEDCSGSPDPTCEADCDTLVDQAPEATYQENACRIESSCEDLAVCSSVSG